MESPGPKVVRKNHHWDRVREISEERQERWDKFLKERENTGQAPKKLEKAKRAKGTLTNGPEGVAAASAARPPEESRAEQTPEAAPPVPAKRPVCPIQIPKDLVIDRVGDFAVTSATGRGQRTRKPWQIVEEFAALSKGKRKWATV